MLEWPKGRVDPFLAMTVMFDNEVTKDLNTASISNPLLQLNVTSKHCNLLQH